jgi:hypothetical protein
MNKETFEQGNSGHGNGGVEFEREDLSTRGVFGFMIGLGVTGIIIYFIIVGMYSFLDKYERSQMTTSSPLVTSPSVMSRVVTAADVEKTFKENGEPMLEIDERGQFRDFLMAQEKELNSYGWVDENAGVAHIPIEKAMSLIVQQGIPVLPQSMTQSMTRGAKTPANAAGLQAPKQPANTPQ